MPGIEKKMDARPDHGEIGYKGSGKLAGDKAIITGGDSGIGKAVAIAFAREGTDLLISYLNKHEMQQKLLNMLKSCAISRGHQ